MGEIRALVDTLYQHVRAAQIVTDTQILSAHAVDGIIPQMIVTPTTTEEAGQIVNIISEHNLTVLPWGKGSEMNLGGQPGPLDVLLKTSSLQRLLEHEAPDLTCRVEAGMTLAQLQTKLAMKGQQLALDPPGADQMTIGGLLATNASGPKRLRYGTARDVVIGLRVIQSNGEIASSGGRVVKNVAGYDLNKLYIGSLGTLGIIAEANFKLHPLPEKEYTLLLTFPTIEDAIQTVIAITRSHLTPAALELIYRKSLATHSGFDAQLPNHGYTLAINYEGSATTITRQINETNQLAGQQSALIRNDLQGKEQEQFWNDVRNYMRGKLTCKVSILVSHIPGYVHAIERICHSHNIEAEFVAHAGNGILYIEISPYHEISHVVAAIEELRTNAQQAHGSLVVERCPLNLKQHINIWGEPQANFQLMQRLKTQFDPKGIFVSGRFLGGL